MQLDEDVKEYLLERLESRTTVLTNGCWIYEGHVQYDGYCRISGLETSPQYIREYFQAAGITYSIQAHKAAFLAAGGELTVDKPLAVHSCFNKRCINPGHVHAGDSFENNNAPDRPRRQVGNGYFSDEKRKEITQSFIEGLSAYRVALKYKISVSGACRFRRKLREKGIC